MEGAVAAVVQSPVVPHRLVTATAGGWAAGIALGVLLIIIAESLGLQSVQTPLVLGVALGVGGLQLRALRPVLAGSGRQWMMLSCIGLAAPFVVVDVAALAGRALPYSLIAYVGIGGVAVGVLQWSVLRRRADHALGWLLAAPLGWFAAASTAWLNDQVLPRTPGLAGAVQYLVVVLAGGVVFGVMAALAAARFRPRRADTRAASGQVPGPGAPRVVAGPAATHDGGSACEVRRRSSPIQE